MRNAILLAVGLLSVSCATVRVDYDYDREVDFTAYTTYNYFSDLDSGMGEMDERRLIGILDSILQTRGYRLAEEPDFYVNILSTVFQAGGRNSVGVGLGGGGRNIGGGISLGIPVGSPALKRSVQIDFVDAQRDALFWQAVAESGYREAATPAIREEKLRNLVKKVFSKFPPKGK